LNKCGYQPFSRQHGTSLLEALIAILLMTIVGLAITYNLAKGTLQQGKLNAQISALNEIRGEVQSSGMNSNCTTTNSSTNTTIKLSTANSSAQSTLTRSCTLTQLSVTVSATTKTVLLPSVSYSVTDSRLGASSLLLQN
jgi:hypothetical protein